MLLISYPAPLEYRPLTTSTLVALQPALGFTKWTLDNVYNYEYMTCTAADGTIGAYQKTEAKAVPCPMEHRLGAWVEGGWKAGKSEYLYSPAPGFYAISGSTTRTCTRFDNQDGLLWQPSGSPPSYGCNGITTVRKDGTVVPAHTCRIRGTVKQLVRGVHVGWPFYKALNGKKEYTGTFTIESKRCEWPCPPAGCEHCIVSKAHEAVFTCDLPFFLHMLFCGHRKLSSFYIPMWYLPYVLLSVYRLRQALHVRPFCADQRRQQYSVRCGPLRGLGAHRRHKLRQRLAL